MYPGVKSIAVVPVGLTDHRERLYKLRTFTKEEAKNVVEQVSSWQKKLKKELGSSFVFLSDEFYVMAGVTIPSYYYYEGFPQIENGVGLMALFKHQFERSLKRLKANKGKNINTTPYLIVTGIAAYNFMEEVAKELRKTGFNVKVEKIHNEFFWSQHHGSWTCGGERYNKPIKRRSKWGSFSYSRCHAKRKFKCFS